MQDRLAELRNVTTRPASVTVPTPTTLPQEGYYEEVEQLKSSMLLIETTIRSIEERYDESLGTTNSTRANVLVLEMDRLVTATNRDSQQVAARIKQLQQSGGATRTDTERRMREQTFNVVVRQFYDLMSRYQTLKGQCRSRYRAKVKHQLEVVCGQPVTDAQVDATIEAGDSSRVFSQHLLQQKRDQDAANALVYVQGRHADVVRLEKSINELYEVFTDMALLVERQGEVLNSIEAAVVSSQEHQEAAVVELEKASDWMVKARQKRCLIIVLVVVCLVVVSVAVAVPVALTLRK